MQEKEEKSGEKNILEGGKDGMKAWRVKGEPGVEVLRAAS